MEYPLETIIPQQPLTEPIDLMPLYELLIEIRDAKESIQYMHLAQLGLIALVVGLLLVLIFSIVWGRH